MTQEEIDRMYPVSSPVGELNKHEDLRIKEILTGRNYATAAEKQRFKVIDRLAQQAIDQTEVEDSEYRHFRDAHFEAKGWRHGFVWGAVLATSGFLSAVILIDLLF